MAQLGGSNRGFSERGRGYSLPPSIKTFGNILLITVVLVVLGIIVAELCSRHDTEQDRTLITWDGITLAWEYQGRAYSIDFDQKSMTDGKTEYPLNDRDWFYTLRGLMGLEQYCADSIVWHERGGIYRKRPKPGKEGESKGPGRQEKL